MVKLFFEIRRNIPQEQQSMLKISDPDIGHRMIELYRKTDDENIKLLTKVFLERAGENWADNTADGSNFRGLFFKRSKTSNADKKNEPKSPASSQKTMLSEK